MARQVLFSLLLVGALPCSAIAHDDTGDAPAEANPTLVEVEIGGALRYATLGSTTRVGLMLDPRVALSLGAAGTYGSQNAGINSHEYGALTLTLGVRVYLADPVAGSATGYLRPSASYQIGFFASDLSHATTHGIEGDLALGVLFLISPELGVSAELGPSVGYRVQERSDADGWMLGFGGATAIVFRAG